MVKRIYHLKEYCLGCRLCEIQCIARNSKSRDLIKAFKHEPRQQPRILLEEKPDYVFLGLQCRHCEDAPCIFYCMTGAMSRNEEGLVLHDPDKCVGCWMCVAACPYGVIQRNEAVGKVAAKCHACADDEVPVCVAACPNEALIIIEEEETVEKK